MLTQIYYQGLIFRTPLINKQIQQLEIFFVSCDSSSTITKIEQ